VYCNIPFTWLLSPFLSPSLPSLSATLHFVAFVPLHRKKTKTYGAFSICNFVFNDFSFEQISCYLTTPWLSFSRFLPAFNFLCNSLWAETIRRWLPISLTLSLYPKTSPKKRKRGNEKKYLVDTKHPHVCIVAGIFLRGFAR